MGAEDRFALQPCRAPTLLGEYAAAHTDGSDEE